MTAARARIDWHLQRTVPISTLLAVLVIAVNFLINDSKQDSRITALEVSVSRLPPTFPPTEIVKQLTRLERDLQHANDQLDEIEKSVKDHQNHPTHRLRR